MKELLDIDWEGIFPETEQCQIVELIDLPDDPPGSTQVSQTIDPIVVACERQVLHYLFKDKAYIERIFILYRRSLEDFKHPTTRLLASIALDYYKANNSVVVEEELLHILDNSYADHKIEEDDYSGALAVFCHNINPEYAPFTAEQFPRIINDWLQAEATQYVRATLLKHSKRLNSLRAVDVATSLIVDLSAIQKRFSIPTCEFSKWESSRGVQRDALADPGSMDEKIGFHFPDDEADAATLPTDAPFDSAIDELF